MERNILDEVAYKISLITMEKAAADNHDHNLKEFLQGICCRNKMRVECAEHFLNNNLMYALHDHMKSRNPNRVFGTAYFIADIAKHETGREFLSNIYLVCLLVGKLKSERDYFIRLQTLRALANMCFENCKTQRLIVAQSPLEIIFTLLEFSHLPFRRENCDRFKEVLVALILNLMSDNDRVVEQIAEKHIPLLIKTMESDLRKRLASSISHNIFVALAALTDVRPTEVIFTTKICQSVVDMYRRSTIREYSIPGLEFLEDSELPDVTKFQFADAGLFDVFMRVVEFKPVNCNAEERRKYELMGRILSNILSGDEAMLHIFALNNAEVLDRFGSWLLSIDKDTIHAGALCLGNLARTDMNSITIVDRGIHRNLLHVIQQTREVRLLYATVSTIRNLCLPKENKRELIDDGMIDVLLPLLDLEVRASSPVIYKAIGAVRQVIENDVELNVRFGTDPTLVRQLVNWATSTLLPWVSTECSRFLISLVNMSRNRNVMITMIENGAYVQMSRMLVALHGLMQSEALHCMTITVQAALNEAMREDLNMLPEEERRKSDVLINFHTVLIECQLAERLKHLFSNHGPKMELGVVLDCLTFLEEAIKIEPIRIHLFYEGFKGLFHYIMRNREDYQQIRARVEAFENACTFF